MRHQNVVQASEESPHKEQSGDDDQRPRVIRTRRDSRIILHRAGTTTCFVNCHVFSRSIESAGLPAGRSRILSPHCDWGCLERGNSSLPPRLSLHSVCQPIRPILIGHSSYEAAQPVRPVRICEKRTQNWPAEELPSSSDLGSDCNLA